MLLLLQRMSILRKLWLVLLVVTTLTLGNGLLALSRLHALNDSTSEIHGNWFTALSHLADVRHALTDERLSVNAHLLAPGGADKAKIEDAIRDLEDRIEASWARYLTTVVVPEEQQLADAFWKAFERYRLRQRPVLELSRQSLATDARALMLQEAEQDCAEGRVSFVNASALQMLGFEESDLLGRPMHAMTHHHYPDGREFPVEECPVHRTLRDGEVRSIHDQVFWRKDGTPLPVEYTVSAVGGDGSPQGVVISFRDISERERTRRELQQRGLELQASEARLRLMFDTAHEGIWVIDAQGRTIDLNPEMCRILGTSRESALGRGIFDFVDETNAAVFRAQMARREHGESSAYEIRLGRPPGRSLRCLFNARPLFDPQGLRTGSFAMVADLERFEQRAAEGPGTRADASTV